MSKLFKKVPISQLILLFVIIIMIYFKFNNSHTHNFSQMRSVTPPAHEYPVGDFPSYYGGEL